MLEPSPRPRRRTADLLIGRSSIPGATCFLTFCETLRRPSLRHPPVTTAIRKALETLHSSEDFRLLAATVMPDRVHVLGILGHRLSLKSVVAKFKTLARPALAAAALEFQANFYDYRLRHHDAKEPFARYICLNPYPARLIPLDATWPHWWRWGDLRFEFEAIVAQTGHVPAPWLDEPDPAGATDL